MISYPEFAQVVDDLGDKVVQGFARSVQLARNDLNEFRTWRPGWVAESSERGLANLIHDRLWAHAVKIMDPYPEVTIIDEEPKREICVSNRYRFRLKRHGQDGHVATYPTETALAFLVQQPPLDGLDLVEVRLVVGYEWDPIERSIGPAVLSLRDGADDVKWMQELPEPAARAGSVVDVRGPQPGGPTPPVIEIGDEQTGHEDETGSS